MTFYDSNPKKNGWLLYLREKAVNDRTTRTVRENCGIQIKIRFQVTCMLKRYKDADF